MCGLMKDIMLEGTGELRGELVVNLTVIEVKVNLGQTLITTVGFLYTVFSNRVL